MSFVNPFLINPNVKVDFSTPRSINYNDVEKDLENYLKQSDLNKEEQDKLTRVILLGTAFEAEKNPIAKTLYENWLFGPKTMSWQNNGSNSFTQNYGPNFNSKAFVARPWYKLKWEKLESISKTINSLERLLKHEFENAASNNNIPEELKNKLSEFVSEATEETTSQPFGDIKPQSFLNPKIHLDNNSLQTTYYDQLWNEKDIGSSLIFGGESLFGTLLYGNKLIRDYYSTPGSMPDIISSLGSFSVYKYISGTYSVKIENGKKTGTFKFEKLGLRIIDPYDFNDSKFFSQPLGVWYPKKGHDLSQIKITFNAATSNKPIQSFPSWEKILKKTVLWNSDFSKLKNSIVNNYNSINPRYRLICDDYYVITPMKIIPLKNDLNPYTIQL